jgi:antitoxin PrlF
MSIPQSKVTAQGQISVPAEVRKKLGIGPGSVLEWHEQDGSVVVRRAGRFSSSEVHQALFPQGAPKGKSVPDVKAGIRAATRRRHARG